MVKRVVKRRVKRRDPALNRLDITQETTQNYLELLRKLLRITQEITQDYLDLLRITQETTQDYLDLLSTTQEITLKKTPRRVRFFLSNSM